MKKYKDVLHEITLAKDVDPVLRGPFGVARMELQEGAVPLKRETCITLGEKEEAIRALDQNLLHKGWIEPSHSECGSQAFLVTKAGVNQDCSHL